MLGKDKKNNINIHSKENSFCLRYFNNGFTIVELLVVIVVIGVLATVTAVSYAGISQKAKVAVITTDLGTATTQLEMDKINTGSYPASVESANNGNGLKASPGVGLSYTYYAGANAYSLVASDTGSNTSLFVTSSNKTPINGSVPSFYSFVKTLGGSGTDYGNSIVQASDGGYVVTGTTYSYGAGGSDAFLVKYDATGNIVWNKTWGGAGNDSGKSLIATKDNGYLVSGQTSSYGAGNDDLFLSKYSAGGDLIWNKTWGGSGNEWNWDVIQTSDGGYAASGCSFSYTSGCAAFLVKYDTNGNLSWNKTWGGAAYDYASSLAQTSDGGYVIAGKTYSYGAGDGLIIKYDAIGNLSWNKTWGGTGDDGFASIIAASDGGYVVTGTTYSYGAGGSDAFLVKYDATGNIVWNKTWGGAGNEEINSIINASDGGYVISGSTSSYGAGGYDSFFAKYDANGNLSWNKTFGGTGGDFGVSLAQTSDGGYVEIGQTSGFGAGGVDLLLVKSSDNGMIAGCSSNMCQGPTVSETTPASGGLSPTTTVRTPTAIIKTPTAIVSSPTMTSNTIIEL